MSFSKKVLIAFLVALLPSLALAAPAAAPAATSAASSFTEAQKAEIEAIVRELLTKKDPEIIIKAAEVVQGKMEKAAAEKGTESIAKYKTQLENDPTSPVAGNPKGDVTVVEFFDYSCGYCKMAQPYTEKLLSEDKNVRFVYKEFAILGQGSQIAAQAALASVAQGKYIPFHNALMEAKEHMDEGIVMVIAKNVGLDVEKLKKDMKDEKIQKILQTNHDLADALGVHGTPSFIIGGKMYPGAMQYEQLKSVIDDVRKEKK